MVRRRGWGFAGPLAPAGSAPRRAGGTGVAAAAAGRRTVRMKMIAIRYMRREPPRTAVSDRYLALRHRGSVGVTDFFCSANPALDITSPPETVSSPPNIGLTPAV